MYVSHTLAQLCDQANTPMYLRTKMKGGEGRSVIPRCGMAVPLKLDSSTASITGYTRVSGPAYAALFAAPRRRVIAYSNRALPRICCATLEPQPKTSFHGGVSDTGWYR